MDDLFLVNPFSLIMNTTPFSKYLHLFFFSNLFLLSSFSKIKRKVQKFPIYPFPHTCLASPLSISSTSAVHLLQPTFIHYDLSESIVDLGIHSLRCTFYGIGQMYNDMYPSLHYYTEYFNCLKKIYCVPVIHSFPLPSPWQPLIFLCLNSFNFSRMSYSWCHMYIALSDWLLSLSNMHLSFLHIFSSLGSSFLFSTE